MGTRERTTSRSYGLNSAGDIADASKVETAVSRRLQYLASLQDRCVADLGTFLGKETCCFSWA